MLPGTPFPLQDFVVAEGIKPTDLYKPGLRSGYDIDVGRWIVPPERDRVHDVKSEEGGFYAWALQMADKMERLLRYEPDAAVRFWHSIHKKRQVDMKKGKGDYAESNVIYKMLAQRGLFPSISQASGEYIAKVGGWWEGDEDWMTGGCGAYAKVFRDLRPDLKIGEHLEHEYNEDDPEHPYRNTQHYFVHDDKNAYDAEGAHPLPYDAWDETAYNVDPENLEYHGMMNGDPKMAEAHIRHFHPQLFGGEHIAKTGAAPTALYHLAPYDPDNWEWEPWADNLYHVAPTSMRGNIEQEGLRAAKPGKGYDWSSRALRQKMPVGVYTFPYREDAENHREWRENEWQWPHTEPHDIWEIAPHPHNIEDPDVSDAFVIPHDVAPERIKRIAKTGAVDWWHPSFEEHIMPHVMEHTPNPEAAMGVMMALRHADELAEQGQPGAIQVLRHELRPLVHDAALAERIEKEWLGQHPEHAYGTPEYEQRVQLADEARNVFGKTATKPPHLRESEGQKACWNCWAYDNGHCEMFGGYKVREDQVCDDWEKTKPTKKKTSAHMLQYDRDQHPEGKGFILDDGSVWTWPTENLRPMHMQYAYKAKQQGSRLVPGSAFHIKDGQVWQYGPGRSLSPEQHQIIFAADPKLELAPSKKQEQLDTTPGYGHGQNVLDILERGSSWTFQGATNIHDIAWRIYEKALEGVGATVNLHGETPTTRYGFRLRGSHRRNLRLTGVAQSAHGGAARGAARPCARDCLSGRSARLLHAGCCASIAATGFSSWGMPIPCPPSSRR